MRVLFANHSQIEIYNITAQRRLKLAVVWKEEIRLYG
jgi:hypothetical protein